MAATQLFGRLKLDAELAREVYADLLFALLTRCRPYEELPGEMDRFYANLQTEAPRFLAQPTRASFAAFCSRTIDTFATRSLVADYTKPIVGVMQANLSPAHKQKLAKEIEAQGAEAAFIGKTEARLLAHMDAKLYKIWQPIYALLAATPRFSHLAFTKAFWQNTPTLTSYFEHLGALNFCPAEKCAHLSQQNLQVNPELAREVAGYARTHAPNLCATHFAAGQPMQLSAEQMAKIEEAKREAAARHGGQQAGAPQDSRNPAKTAPDPGVLGNPAAGNSAKTGPDPGDPGVLGNPVAGNSATTLKPNQHRKDSSWHLKNSK